MILIRGDMDKRVLIHRKYKVHKIQGGYEKRSMFVSRNLDRVNAKDENGMAEEQISQ